MKVGFMKGYEKIADVLERNMIRSHLFEPMLLS